MTQVIPKLVQDKLILTGAKSQKKTRSKKLLILICAFNEEDSLPILLDRLGNGRDILVIDDGSVDRTRIVATRFRANVLVHEERLGKAASLADGISYALQNSYEYVIEIGADAIPQEGAIEKILERLDKDTVGAVSCKQIPVGRGSVASRMDDLIWGVLAEGKKHQMRASGTSHLGAVMFGFRPKLVDSVEGSVNDDEEVGISIKKKGYRIEFRDDVVAFFDASSTIGHIFERRKRMYYGHMRFAGSSAPSMEMSTSSVALTKTVLSNPKRIVWVLPTLILDIRARLLAWRDSRDPNKSKSYLRWVTTYAKDNSLVIRNSSD
ncbi:MAG TPA: glycosyltransferase [Nitrososphaerales archaeon]|nr:glycosyltransferase [Nitrososphaerales archaeon]